MSDIQDYFEYILEKHVEGVDEPSVRIYVNKIEKRITFNEMKLLGSTENKITKDKNSGRVPHLEIMELVLVHCDIVNNDYQQDSRGLYTFVLNKPFGSLLEIFPINHIFFGLLF